METFPLYSGAAPGLRFVRCLAPDARNNCVHLSAVDRPRRRPRFHQRRIRITRYCSALTLSRRCVTLGQPLTVSCTFRRGGRTGRIMSAGKEFVQPASANPRFHVSVPRSGADGFTCRCGGLIPLPHKPRLLRLRFRSEWLQADRLAVSTVSCGTLAPRVFDGGWRTFNRRDCHLAPQVPAPGTSARIRPPSAHEGCERAI